VGVVEQRAQARRPVSLCWAVVIAVGIFFAAAGSATAATCPAVNPHAKTISLTPPGGELPVGTSGTFLASVGELGGIISQPGKTVTFRVVCGPNVGESGQSQTKSQSAVTPRIYEAPFTVYDREGAGTDVISATTGRGKDSSTATIEVQWAVPSPTCDASLHFLAALRCSGAYNFAHTVIEFPQCLVGVGSFFIAEAKFAKILKAADTLVDAKKAARTVGAGSSIAQLAVDLRALSADGISISRVESTIKDAKSAKDFITGLWALLKDVSSSDAVSQVALDVANLTGLGSCVNLLAAVVPSPPPPPPPPPSTVPLGSLCDSDFVTVNAAKGCPYTGTTTIGTSSFAYTVLVKSNNDSVSPAYWDLIDFPATTCRSITLTFGLPNDGSQPGDTASIEVVTQSMAPQSATVAYGGVGTLTATLDGGQWSLENSASNGKDPIAINGVATCSSSTGY
jgi:hypothetical protein